jgi:hypothetical protein
MKVFHRNFSIHKDALSASSSLGVPAIQRSGTTESQSEDGGDDKFARVHCEHVFVFNWYRKQTARRLAARRLAIWLSVPDVQRWPSWAHQHEPEVSTFP